MKSEIPNEQSKIIAEILLFLLLQVSREFSVGSSSPEHHSMMSNSGGGGKRVHPMVFDDACSGIFYTPISQ